MSLKNKITALLVSLMLLVGLVLPANIYADATFNITVHKIKLKTLPTDDDFAIETNGTNIGERKGKNNTTFYNGGQINDLAGYFGSDNAPVEMEGVDFRYWEISKAMHDFLLANPAKLSELKTKEKVTEFAGEETEYTLAGGTNNEGITATTTNSGVVINLGADLTTTEKYYLFIEDNFGKALPDGSSATDAYAVPFLLAFPMTKPATGTPFASGELHVYPKNTVSKPEISKKIVEEATQPARTTPKEVELGSVVNFEIKTKVPLGVYYANMKWDDRMTDGLTFNSDTQVEKDKLKVTYKRGVNGAETVLAEDNYILTPSPNGFSLELSDDGRDLINPETLPEGTAKEDLYITITYSAIVNTNAIETIPDRNEVSFIYGNDPTEENTPIPNKPTPDPNKPGPNNGKIKAVKSFVAKNGVEAPTTWSVQLQLVNANTGANVGQPVTITNETENHEYEWTDLDTNYEYKVVEISRVAGFVPVYELDEANPGTTKVKNTTNNNPPPIVPPVDPKEPPVTVQTFGKRFVKTNDQQAVSRLPGAEFIVSKEQDGTKYLKVTFKDGGTAYEAALTAYRTAVDTYNKAEPKNADALSPVTQAHIALSAAFKAQATAYTWVENRTEATIFATDEIGRLEISGLAKGNYKLHEVRAPLGYALRQSGIDFVADETSLTTGDIDYYTDTARVGDATNNKAQKIINKLISIPQTGGMGTIIFTVVGISLMLLALVAMKRSRKEQ